MHLIRALPVALAPLLVMVGACSTTIELTRPVSPESFATIAKSVNGEQATIIFDERGPSGTKMVMRRGRLDVSSEQSFVLTAREGRRQIVPFQATHQMTVKRHGGTALGGLVAGMVAGFVASAVLGAAIDSREGPDLPQFFPLLAIGATGGGLLGAIAGHRTTFRIYGQP